MSGLFEGSGNVFPLADIASIQNQPAVPGRAERYVVHKLSDRRPSQLFSWEFAELISRPLQLSPAAPGTYLLRSYTDDQGPFLDALPILSWALCVDGQTRPILPSGVHQNRIDHLGLDFIKLPDGSIYQFGYEAEPDRLADVNAVLALLKKRLEARDRETAPAKRVEGGAEA